MSGKRIIVALTEREVRMLSLCVSGELENGSPYNSDYFVVLARVQRKIAKAQSPREALKA